MEHFAPSSVLSLTQTRSQTHRETAWIDQQCFLTNKQFKMTNWTELSETGLLAISVMMI